MPAILTNRLTSTMPQLESRLEIEPRCKTVKAVGWFASVLCVMGSPNGAAAQSLGSAGTLKGVVTDSSGALLPSVLTELSNPVTGYTRKAVTGPDGNFRINHIPQNNYRLRVSLEGFEPHTTEVSIRSSVPVELGIQMAVAGQRTSVTVEAAATNLLENIPTASSTVDRRLIAELPTSSADSGLNDAIIQTTAGVAADSNGFFQPPRRSCAGQLRH